MNIYNETELLISEQIIEMISQNKSIPDKRWYLLDKYSYLFIDCPLDVPPQYKFTNSQIDYLTLAIFAEAVSPRGILTTSSAVMMDKCGYCGNFFQPDEYKNCSFCYNNVNVENNPYNKTGILFSLHTPIESVLYFFETVMKDNKLFDIKPILKQSVDPVYKEIWSGDLPRWMLPHVIYNRRNVANAFKVKVPDHYRLQEDIIAAVPEKELVKVNLNVLLGINDIIETQRARISRN